MTIAVDLGRLETPPTLASRLAAWRLVATMSAAQLEIALRGANRWAGVAAIVAALPVGDPVEVLWRRISIAERSSPLWDQFKATLGMTDAEIDALPFWTPARPE